MNRDLVVIESPGKLKTLHRVFGEIGFHADVCATIGHFLENPPSLKDIAIEVRDGEFVETKRRPSREDSYRYLCDQIRKCAGRILIATDNDHEGHVIAQDVAALIASLAPARPVLRMLMGGLDRDSIRRALASVRPLEAAKAIPGTARRISDRLIGACMSDFARNRPVGRVQSALLGLCAEGLAHTRLHIKMPSADGGKPFVGEVPVFGTDTPAKLIAQLGGLDLPPAPVATSEACAASVPLTYGDALIGLNRSLGMDITQAAQLLQQMYESGDISYPRTSSHGLTDAGIESASRLARTKGLLAFKSDILPRVAVSSPHEAIRVLNEDRARAIDIGKPLKLHESDRDAAFVFIARRTLEAGLPALRETPDLAQAPAWAREVEWQRTSRRTILPWRYPDPPQAVGRDMKAALVETMVHAGIGRPSTYAPHAARFAERELLDYKFELTPKAREWLDLAPPALKRADTSARIEALLETEDHSASDVVRQVLDLAAGGDAAALESIYDQLEAASDAPEDIDDPEFRFRPAF